MKERKESNYEYHFVNGESVVINLTIHLEGDFDWWKLLKEFDRQEYNNDHAETRRHCSLEAYDEDERLESNEPDALAKILEREHLDEIYGYLSSTERKVFYLFFELGYKQKEIAKILGIDFTRVSHVMGKIKRKVKKNEKF